MDAHPQPGDHGRWRGESRTDAGSSQADAHAAWVGEQHYRMLVDGIADEGLFLLDPQGHVLTWNTGACRLQGYHDEEMRGQHFSRFLPVDERRDCVAARMLELAGRDGRYEEQLWLVRKNGTRYWGSIVFNPVRSGRDGLHGFAAVVRDLSEQKQAEDDLRASEKRLRMLIEKISLRNQLEQQRQKLRQSDEALRESQERLELAQEAGRIGTFEWNLRTQQASWSGAQEQLFGVAPGCFAGTLEHWWTLIHPDDRRRVQQEVSEAVAKRSPLFTEFRVPLDDGSVRWITTKAKVFCDSDGQPLRLLGVSFDTTDQRRAEQALREESQRKDQYLAMLAHELRNPLAPLRNALHVLSLRNDPATVEQLRAMMERQVEHMIRLVDDLLDVSRLQRGKITLQTERLDLAWLVRTHSQDYRPAFQEAAIRLNVETPETPVWVIGDATRLRQVLDNLFSNALKFTPTGGCVTVRVDALPGDEAQVSVTDTGIGIAPDVVPRVFDVFAQADCSLDRSQGGLGLGLAMVKGLVELHGGRAFAKSAGPQQGSTFAFVLRREPELPALAESNEGVRNVPGQRRVLVIEDNRDSADSLRLLLQLSGYEVRVAYDGLAGVSAAREWRPDVVLCDIGLPRLDGFGVAATLRNDPRGCDLRLIAVTGYGREEERRRALDAGFDDHLVKPADPQRLMDVLEKSRQQLGVS